MTVAAEQMDSCGKRDATVEVDSPESAKKSKLNTSKEDQTVAEIKSFDPSFGVGRKQVSEEKAVDDIEGEESEDESGDDSQDDEDGSDADESSNVLEELVSMFKEQNGRDPTEQEVKMWVETLKETLQDSPSGVKNEKDVKDKGETRHFLLSFRIPTLK
jgi:hypothetical protein